MPQRNNESYTSVNKLGPPEVRIITSVNKLGPYE
jgi:hypothetical protein